MESADFWLTEDVCTILSPHLHSLTVSMGLLALLRNMPLPLTALSPGLLFGTEHRTEKVLGDFSHPSRKRQLLVSLSDNTICCLCDKQHTTKQYLSETHMRHDPLQLAIYSKRQCLCQPGAYVIRKMTPSKTWLQFCASFCFCFCFHFLGAFLWGFLLFGIWGFVFCFLFFSAYLRSIWGISPWCPKTKEWD